MRFRSHTAYRISMQRSRSSVRRRRLAPRLEALEARLVLSTLTVTSAADSGLGSLHAAIAAAGSGDTIVFAPSLDGQTIRLTVEHGDQALLGLLRALDAAEVELASIQLARPTLDDVFLTLTGRSLREDTPAAAI